MNKNILKEYKEMSLQSFSDGQIEVDFPDENDLTNVRVILKPNDGYYKDGKFEFAVKLPQDYPQSAPSVSCKTKMFHPNIAYTGYICFNILGDEWDSSLRLVDYVHSLLWLLYQPNLDSRLNSDCPQDEQRFAQLVQKSIRGGRVEGQTFPVALADPSLLQTAEAPNRVATRPVDPRTLRDLRAFWESFGTTTTTPRAAPTPVPTTTTTTTTTTTQAVIVQPEEAVAAEEPQPAQPLPEPVEQQPIVPQPEATIAEPEPQPQAQAPAQQEPRQQRTAVPREMRWAQFILPSIQPQTVTRPTAATVRPARRWAPVSPPLRFAGTVRVY